MVRFPQMQRVQLSDRNVDDEEVLVKQDQNHGSAIRKGEGGGTVPLAGNSFLCCHAPAKKTKTKNPKTK